MVTIIITRKYESRVSVSSQFVWTTGAAIPFLKEETHFKNYLLADSSQNASLFYHLPSSLYILTINFGEKSLTRYVALKNQIYKWDCNKLS